MWKYRVVELYCGIYWDSCWQDEETIFRFDSETGPDAAAEVENTDYDPSAPKPVPPVFCKRMVGVECLKNNCRHVAYCYIEDEDADPGEVSHLTRS